MQIGKNKVVTLLYTLTDDDGNVVDSSQDGSFAYLHGASNIIPGLENALSGKGQGDELSVVVAPEEGYGSRDDAKTVVVPRDMFPPNTDIEVGMQFHAQSPDGQNLLVTVVQVEGDRITVDGNHPLAGTTLNFEVKVVDVRDATDDEIGHGHVHGPGDHAH
jgi:FKBP-type peptidyl-prolyl cis-trans isomerase SlyD